MNAPVALFVYNRPEHTKKTLDALRDNRGVENTELFIFSDGVKDETEIENVNSVREYILTLEKESPFKKVHISLSKENQGLEKSIIRGVTELINQYGRIIVLEDDIITSPDFLLFMNKALDAYKEDPRVWSISSYTLESKRIKKCSEDVLWTYRGECWGWASWSDRWNKVDWEVEDYSFFKHNHKLQKQFNRAGRDMTSLLNKQQMGEINSWAIRWCYQQFKEDMITIFPKYPKSYNNGLDGSGTNCSQETYKNVKFVVEKEWNFNYSLKNKILLREFQKMYSRNFWRQEIGKFWYLLSEYEYCLAYRNDDGEYNILKPDFKAWYADPIPFLWNEEQYVLVEVYQKFLNKGVIGLCELDINGKLLRPRIILEEPFHLSFPNVFTVDGQVYMIPECSATKQLRVYRMQGDIYHWEIYKIFKNVGELVDTVVYQNENGNLYFLCCEVNQKNKHQTRLRQYEVQDFNDPLKIKLKISWEQREYSYVVRNGGGFINDSGQLYRVAQQSTEKVYGKAVILNKIVKIDEESLNEVFFKKMTPYTVNIHLPNYIYRKWGIHTYGKTNGFEIIDLFVQRFSLGGLWLKLWRRISNIWEHYILK